LRHQIRSTIAAGAQVQNVSIPIIIGNRVHSITDLRISLLVLKTDFHFYDFTG
jgi:hypothetical protein